MPAKSTTVAASPGDSATGNGSAAGPDEPAPGQGEVSQVGDDTRPALSRAERRAVATARDYLSGLDARDGRRVCELLVPGTIEQVELPRERGGCAASLDASIGYRDPRGLPVWRGSSFEGVASVEADEDRASVVATVFTRFADRPNPSLEDDPIYLRRTGGGWLIAQPSLTLYRAVGIAEPPPSALAPPRG